MGELDRGLWGFRGLLLVGFWEWVGVRILEFSGLFAVEVGGFSRGQEQSRDGELRLQKLLQPGIPEPMASHGLRHCLPEVRSFGSLDSQIRKIPKAGNLRCPSPRLNLDPKWECSKEH